MPDLYSTDVLLGVLADLAVPKSALLDRYFPTVQMDQAEEIHFDLIDGAKKLAPFVSPVVAGRVMQQRGYTTKTFKPAYVKPKTPLDPNRPLKRFLGERIGGGEMSAADREAAILVMEQEAHVQLIRNRLEWMAAQILVTGSVTISGDDYQTVVVNYGRHVDHTVTLSGAALWSAQTAVPLDDLQDWATNIAKNGGGEGIDVVMEPSAWKEFRAHAAVVGKLDYRSARGDEINLGAMRERGLSFKGTIDGFNIFVYQDWYETDAGVVTPFLASGTVVMASPDIEGVQAFGAVQDPTAGYIAVPFYPKSWIEDDPPRRFLMTQSAPLVVPLRPNGSVAATVL